VRIQIFCWSPFLWGNVGINVLLTLLSSSVLTGVASFLFSTVVITLVGEIAPQAYFSRHALRMAALLGPVLKIYQYLFYPVAKPSALILDLWLGKESIQYFREKDIREIIRKHVEAEGSDIDTLEGGGAMNFLAIDDLLVVEEGVDIDLESIVPLPDQQGQLGFPDFVSTKEDHFIQAVSRSKRKWAVLTDLSGYPRYVLDVDKFVRGVFLGATGFNPWSSCHIPIVVSDPKLSLGDVILQMKGLNNHIGDDPIDKDVVLVWGQKKRIITGADILGRLLKGVVKL